MACWMFTTANAHRVSRLTWSERYLFVQALVLLPVVALTLRSVGFGPLQRIIVRLSRTQQGVPVDQSPYIRTSVWAIAAAARHARLDPNCLERSLLLWWLLRRRGVAAVVRIGVRKDASLLQAHAWIEVDGQVVADRTDVGAHFTPFERAIVPVAGKTP
jgi:hypothetical protein